MKKRLAERCELSIVLPCSAVSEISKALDSLWDSLLVVCVAYYLRVICMYGLGPNRKLFDIDLPIIP